MRFYITVNMNELNPMSRLFVFAIMIGMMIPASFLVIEPATDIIRGRFRNWQEVNGVVSYSHLDLHGESRRKSPYIRSLSSRGSTTHRAIIHVDYEVDGQMYSTNRVKVGDSGWYSSLGYQKKFDLVEQHPVGKIVTIYYDADDPSYAVLQRNGRDSDSQKR